MSFVTFMENRSGRLIRVVLGLALIGLGAALGGGFWAFVAVGAVALLAGVVNFCLVAPLFRAPFRAAVHRA